ncbi:MAG: hypothetical protein ACOC0P_05815, partial [Planctomycetota bacterium]
MKSRQRSPQHINADQLSFMNPSALISHAVVHRLAERFQPRSASSNSLLIALTLLIFTFSTAAFATRPKAFMLVEIQPAHEPLSDPQPQIDDIPQLSDCGTFVATLMDDRNVWGARGTNARYEIMPIDHMRATGVNRDGTVIGWSIGPNENIWGFAQRSDGRIFEFPRRRLEFINDCGHIVAWSTEGQWELIRGINATEVQIDPIPVETISEVDAIGSWDNFPIVVGRADRDNRTHLAPVAWTPAGIVSLQAAPDLMTVPTAANNNKVIVGYEEDRRGRAAAVAWILNFQSGLWTATRVEGPAGIPQDVNDHDEVLMPSGIWKINRDPSADQTFVRVTETMNIPTLFDDKIPQTLRSINNQGQMVGLATKQDGTQVAFRVVPYDLDNDYEPDYRQILADPMLDRNDDWVLDAAQEMRTGFFTVWADDEQVASVRPIQIVRIMQHQDDISDYLNDPEWKARFERDLNMWGHERGAEIILTVRTYWENPLTLWDRVPTGEEHERVLNNLRELTRRYARHIDYIQLGNEVFTGVGQLRMESWEIPNDPNFGGGPIRNIEGEGLEDAAKILFKWCEEQAEAIREGALEGGRPIRLISPVLSRQQIEGGASGDPFDYENMRSRFNPRVSVIDSRNRGALATLRLLQFADNVCDVIDIHGRYHQHEDDLLRATDALFELDTPWGRRDLIPYNMAAITEWAPMPEPLVETGQQGWTWWQLHNMEPPLGREPNVNAFRKGADRDKYPHPGMSWDEFLLLWHAQTDLDDNFGIGRALENFNKHGFIFACYAPFSHYGTDYIPELNPFSMSALHPRYIDPEFLDDDGMSLYREEYNRVAWRYEIPNFNPHPHP